VRLSNAELMWVTSVRHGVADDVQARGKHGHRVDDTVKGDPEDMVRSFFPGTCGLAGQAHEVAPDSWPVSVHGLQTYIVSKHSWSASHRTRALQEHVKK
jgi:hypothetical protein